MRSTFNMTAAFAALIIAIILPLTGCDEDPTSTGEIAVRPKIGSFYVFSSTNFDTSGAPRPGYPRIDTMTVIDTGGTIGARSGVIRIRTLAKSLVWAHYESNGDFTLIDSIDTNNDNLDDAVEARTYSFGSHGRKETDRDTTRNTSDNHYTVHLDSMIYTGNQSLTISAGTFNVSKVAHVMDHRTYSEAGVQTSRIREIITYHFAPSIGFFALMTNEHEFFNTDGTSRLPRLSSRHELTAYMLK